MDSKIKQQKRLARQKRVRAKILGSQERPRLSVFRSNKSVYLQLIDDTSGQTIASAHSSEIKPGQDKSSKSDIGHALGKLLAKKALEKQVTKVVFDRASYRYHGRVASIAEGAREGGLEF
jgi:large subunit ribosomal protein L18